MQASEACVDLVAQFEGFRAEPYIDPAGIPTIGYGSTHYADGSAVTMNDLPVTEAQARDMMLATLQYFATLVDHYVQVVITQNEFDALVEFAYNCGPGNLKSSTLMAMVNQQDFEGAAGQFSRWIRAAGVVIPGLMRRREAERKLFVGEA